MLLGVDGHPDRAGRNERAADGARRAGDSAGEAVAPRGVAGALRRRDRARRGPFSGSSRYNSRMTTTRWRMVADETTTCNCAWGCPCQFNALPTHGRCEAVTAVRIREGHYGPTKLDGVTF